MPHRLILCEKTSRWAVAFRRAVRGPLGQQSASIVETRSLAQCGQQLSAAPASIVAVETTADNLEALVGVLPGWLRRFPHSRAIALLDESLAAAELLLREAGAIAIFDSPSQAAAAVRLVRRHLARIPREAVPLEEAIAAGLPWPHAARSAAAIASR